MAKTARKKEYFSKDFKLVLALILVLFVLFVAAIYAVALTSFVRIS